MEAQPKTFSLEPEATGRMPSSSFARTTPSAVISLTSSVAFAEVSSVMVPLPETRSSIVDMGPVQIRFTTMVSASRMARPDCARIIFFFALGSLRTAIITTIASSATTPNAMR